VWSAVPSRRRYRIASCWDARFEGRTLSRNLCLLVVGLGLSLPGDIEGTFAQSGPDPQPRVQELGDGRYRVGQITIDRTRQLFSVSGKIIDLGAAEMPLEFLAVAKGGAKAYESILELDASAIEFNLACILIGLDNSKAVQARGHFDPTPVEGDPVELWLAWDHLGKEVRKPVGDILKLQDAASATDEWVYTGSYFTDDGQYAAQAIGLLVGFVHDPESIIQHRSGLGLQGYGAVTFRPSAAPLSGTPITLTVIRR